MFSQMKMNCVQMSREAVNGDCPCCFFESISKYVHYWSIEI
jgi:hypothetical protein